MGQFAIVDKSIDNAARINVLRNVSRTERKYFDVDIVVQNESIVI